MPNAAPNYRWDHIHLRSPDPDATAAWFERILGAQVIRSTVEGKPRIDLKLGGADVFIMPVAPGDKVNPPPVTPYQGLDHFGLTVSGIDRWPRSSKPRAWNSPWSRAPTGPACASVSCAVRKASRSSSWSGTRNTCDAAGVASHGLAPAHGCTGMTFGGAPSAPM